MTRRTMTATASESNVSKARLLVGLSGVVICVTGIIVGAVYFSVQEATRSSELIEIPTVPGDYLTWPSRAGKDAQAVMESYGRNYRHRKVRGAQLVVRIGEDHKARLFYKVYYDQH